MYSKYEKGQTPGHTRTGRSCTKEAGRSSGLKFLTLPGRRNTMSGPRGPPRNFPSGSVRDLARRPESQNPLKAMKTMVPLLLMKKRRNMTKKKRKKKRRRRKRRKNKLT